MEYLFPLRVSWMTPKQAEAHTRLVYNVPSHVGLGWTPYTIIVQTRGCLAHTAFTNARDFRRWLKANGYTLRITGRFLGDGLGNRVGRIARMTSTTPTNNPANLPHVVRYVPTYINRQGLRTLAGRAQGRDTFDTPRAAQKWIDTVVGVNSADVVRQVYGVDPRFEVRACACFPGHFDPIGIYFDCEMG